MILIATLALSIFCILKTRNVERLNKWDILFFLSSWQVFDLGYWQRGLFFLPTDHGFAMASVFMVILSFWYLNRRGLDLGLSKWQRFYWGPLGLAIIGTILIPLGFLVGLLEFNLRFDPVFIGKNVFRFFLLVAPVEELVFRGFVQNVLEKTFPKRWMALFAATFLFAFMYTHICTPRGCPDWSFMPFAFVAGLFYGISYTKAGNILVPVFVHGAVDTIWKVWLSR